VGIKIVTATIAFGQTIDSDEVEVSFSLRREIWLRWALLARIAMRLQPDRRRRRSFCDRNHVLVHSIWPLG